jgi:hypothetical protein
MANANFTQVMDELRQAQRTFRMPPAVNAIGGKYPTFVRTCWLFMIDTLAYFVDNLAKCTYHLMDCGQALGYPDRLPLEIVELDIILLPFDYFINALKMCACALADVVPLLMTDPIHKAFHEFHIELLARLMVNNREVALAAHTITLQDRQELRELESGYSTHGIDEPVTNSLMVSSLSRRVTLILPL